MDTLLGFLFILLWASAATAAKIGIRDVAPLTLLDARFFIAGAVLLVYLYAIQKNTPLPKRHEWRQLLILGFCNSTGYLGLSWLAVKIVPAGLFGLFVATNPFFVALLSRVFLKRCIARNEWLGICVAAAGLAVATLPRLQGKDIAPVGVAMLLGAMLIYSCGSVYYKWAKVQLSGVQLNAWQVFIGAVLLLPLAVLLSGSQPTHFSSNLVLALSWSVVAVSIAANLLWFYLLKKDALRANMWLLLNPIFGYAIAWWVLSEPMHPTDFAGLVLVMTGLLMSGTIRLPALRKPPKENNVAAL